MSHFATTDQLEKLKTFTEHCMSNPSLLNLPQFSFMNNFIKHFGGKVPETKSDAKIDDCENSESEEYSLSGSEESDLELDMTGVIEPDENDSQKMGDPTDEPTDDNISESQAKRSEAVAAYIEKDFEKAIELYTKAIVLNPQAALLYAKRGQVFLDLKKPNACIRDCNRALELNADSAAAHKFRGRAYQLLGKWKEAANDLRFACQLDFDEQADEWLREVTPNARKIEDHERKRERKASEKLEKERLERLKKAQKAAQVHENDNSSSQTNTNGGTSGATGGFYQFLNDPDVLQAFQDKEVAEAFKNISTNPANMIKYQSNPKIMALINKFAAKFGGVGGMEGMGGFPGMAGGGMPRFAGAEATTPKSSAPSDDVGLD